MVLFKWQHSNSYVMPQPTDLFCHTIFFAKFSVLTSFSLQFCGNIERAYTPTLFSSGARAECPPYSMEGPFSNGFSWQMGDKFWEANLWRGCSAWGINDQIIMPRAGEFSLVEQVRTALRFALWD